MPYSSGLPMLLSDQNGFFLTNLSGDSVYLSIGCGGDGHGVGMGRRVRRINNYAG